MNCPVSRSFDAALAERERVEVDYCARCRDDDDRDGRGGTKAARASSAR